MSENYDKNATEAWERSKICAAIATERLKQEGHHYPRWYLGMTSEDIQELYLRIRRYSEMHGTYTYQEIQKQYPMKDEEDERPRKQFKPTNYRDPYD